MLAFVIRRLAQSLVVLFAMSILVFASVYLIGNPADILISMDSDQAERARLVESMGLDRPLLLQYQHFLSRALHGDLGKSFVHGVPAIALVLERLPATLELACVAMAIALLIGIPLGLWAGLRPESMAGKAIMTGSILGFSLPTFWVGLMLIVVFSVQLGWLPAGGRGPTRELLGLQLSMFSAEGLRHLLLPAVNLALFKLALVTRLTRAGTREALTQDYVRFARAKGLSPVRVVGVHVLKNIMVPIVTVMALEFGALVAFAAVTETIFAWPGAGKLIIESIGLLDRPVVVAYLLIVVSMFTLLNLLVDIAYSALDPRVRLSDQAA
ncbi:peptide/nickel transport system permease protein [Variovorax sp. CF079]|uniref:ABC transporter permease n=1 Tax=Variovorax sp. CF079 TaxID=1882774 RepID=UPI000880948B|nr:ABC transporter permease [Variovorax sp. CF079]SDE40834.1 peptide/nickel transport system permease protein [Variovorax sp. CF079]